MRTWPTEETSVMTAMRPARVADGLAEGAVVKDGSLKAAHHVAGGPVFDGPDADGHVAEEGRCCLASA